MAGFTNPVLAISKVAIADAGEYKLVATNVVNAATSSVAALSILLPPTLAPLPANSNIIVGSTIVLSIDVTGPGPFTYQWMLQRREYIKRDKRFPHNHKCHFRRFRQLQCRRGECWRRC